MAASVRPNAAADHLRRFADDRAAIVDDSFPNVDVIDTPMLTDGELPPPPVSIPPDLEALSRQLFANPSKPSKDEPTQVAGFEILGVLGRGGMGIVYLAKQPGLNRFVALKMLKAGLDSDSLHSARFQTEVEAIARLQHPNIVQVFEMGAHEGRPYCVLEYVPGGTLAQACRDHLPPPRAAAEIMATIADAVQYAHDRGVLHRDLKPANVLVCRQSSTVESGIPSAKSSEMKTADISATTVKIADFGLAKWLDPSRSSAQTEAGLIIGTPSYMAPEQVAGGSAAIGVTTDVYALGSILYELMTGRPPFKADTPVETARQTQFDEPTPPRKIQPALPKDLETICLRCLQKSPERRYPSARALADELRRFCAGEPIQARPVGAVERAWKWSRRRPAVAALIAVAAATVTTSAVAGWAFAAREREHARIVTGERDAANRARQEKERYLQQTLETNERIRQLTDLFFSSTVISTAPKGLLHEIAEVYRQEADRDKDNPDMTVRRVRAKGLSRLAETLRHLGKAQEAHDWKHQSVALFRQLVADNPADADLQLELGMSINGLGQHVRRIDRQSAERHAEAISLHREAVAILSQLPPALDRHHGHSALGAALNNLGAALLEEKDPNLLPEIRSLFEKAIDLQGQANRVKSTNLNQEFLAIHHGGLADTLVRMSNHAAAAEQVRKMLKVAPNDARLKSQAAKLLQSCARLASADPDLAPEQRQLVATSYQNEAQQLGLGTNSRTAKTK